jgi:hypothetical protein
MALRVRNLGAFFAAWVIGAITPLCAATPKVAANPALSALVGGVTGEEAQDLDIAKLTIEARIHGMMADVHLQADFTNPSDETVEGTFKLALPTSAVVTGYALDIDGVMVDGVLADKARAKAAYEDQVREGVDPGLAEVSTDNIFSSRIFPIFPKKGRTIGVRFSAPLRADGSFILPLMTTRAVGLVTLRLSASGMRVMPKLVLPEKMDAQWRASRTGWTAEVMRQNLTVSGQLAVENVRPASALLAASHDNGRLFFQISDTAANPSATRARPERVRIYWDSSLSRRDDMLEAEMALVKSYLRAAEPGAIDVVRFNSATPETTTLRAADDVAALLTRAVYRGGTSFKDLDRLKVPEAQICLLFSDGKRTFDLLSRFKPDCVVHAISSARGADMAALTRLALATGGHALQLTDANKATLVQQLLTPAVVVVDVRDMAGEKIAYRSFPAGRGSWTIVGEMPLSGDITLKIAGLGNRLETRQYQTGNVVAARLNAPASLWAADEIGELTADPSQIEQLRNLSRRYSVASPAMAFIVLETPEDYAQADIRPPATYPKPQLAAYRRARAEIESEKAQEKAERLDDVVALWVARKIWWKTKFDAPVRKKEKARSPGAPVVPAPAPVAAPARVQREAAADASGDTGDLIVTGSRRRNPDLESVVPVSVVSPDAKVKVEIASALADRPYLKALDSAAEKDRLAVLAVQEKIHGTLPGFYLDVAEWFRLKGDTALAALLLQSALELAAANDETLLIVATRLLREGDMDRAVFLFEQLNARDDTRPQPARSLALALAARAEKNTQTRRMDLQRAHDLLTAVVMTAWEDDFDGIEVISLMEINALMPQLQNAGVKTTLDKRLIAKLDTDVRIVIEWTADASDIDLWIDEPSGETAMYSNPETDIGGQVSNDMTQGFGPEEYVLKTAPKGRYQVKINGYAPDRINPNGTSRVIVRLIRNFGRATIQTDVVDVELASRGEEKNKSVATLVID